MGNSVQATRRFLRVHQCQTTITSGDRSAETLVSSSRSQRFTANQSESAQRSASSSREDARRADRPDTAWSRFAGRRKSPLGENKNLDNQPTEGASSPRCPPVKPVSAQQPLAFKINARFKIICPCTASPCGQSKSGMAICGNAGSCRQPSRRG